MTSNRDEAQTRTEIIDSQLSRSGWSRCNGQLKPDTDLGTLL
ncbi:Uncharacterised protein [Yersinia intermedia]|nr:hypothetical protein [Yersinia intermedia]MDA5512650.1 hypothetical protein [Yersinia intermedia]CNH46355.1 Uncharacterised protein [Yersinia intermedia]CQD77416.1 Uncharacterised protein [Yersinia intermedia]